MQKNLNLKQHWVVLPSKSGRYYIGNGSSFLVTYKDRFWSIIAKGMVYH